MRIRIEDELLRGFAAGAIAGLVMIIPDHILFLLGFNTVRYLDWAAIMLFGYPPEALWTTAFAQIGHLFFAGVLGVIFLFVLPRMHTKHLYFAGWLYSVVAWFILDAVVRLFKAPFLTTVAAGTTLTNFVGATVYGIVLVWAMVWLEGRKRAT